MFLPALYPRRLYAHVGLTGFIIFHVLKTLVQPKSSLSTFQKKLLQNISVRSRNSAVTNGRKSDLDTCIISTTPTVEHSEFHPFERYMYFTEFIRVIQHLFPASFYGDLQTHGPTSVQRYSCKPFRPKT